MSTKQFISAEEHLAKLGITVQQANDFIVENVDNPELLFVVARQNGVTNSMLSEITNISTSVISDYFVAADINSLELDQTSILVNSDLGFLETLVDFNHNTGILSNASLSEIVQPQVDGLYEFTFETHASLFPFYLNDGIYDAEELGVGHLTDVAATSNSLESLFYGSLINMFRMLDESELNQINLFPEDGTSEDFQALLVESLSESPSSFIWTDEQLAALVTIEAAANINEFWANDGNPAIGIVDRSYVVEAII